MSLYNMLFGINSQTDLLLAVLGFRKNDVERLRNVFVEDEGKTIAVYTRTGGGNRSDYPQVALYRSPLFRSTQDDDFDRTYATFYFNTPAEYVEDVKNLSDVIGNGLRKEFAQHLAATLNREPTDSDKETAAYESEQRELARTNHVKANGHTFVPHDDGAMEAALKLAEERGGELRTCWGILPLTITVKRNEIPYPRATDEKLRTFMRRIEVGYEWVIDEDYWQHCQEKFGTTYPQTMAKIAEAAENYRKRKSA